MDYDLGESALIPLPQSDPAGDVLQASDFAVSVRLPDATTAGPFTPTDDDFALGFYRYTSTQTGQHRFRVLDSTDHVVVEGSFYVWPIYTAHTAAWAPSLADVAGLVPTRTIDSAGTQQNTFTTLTLPTATQVQGFIDRIVSEVAGVAGEIPSARFAQAKHTATLGVAWLVERSFPPTSGVQNVANDFVNDYRASLRALTASAREGASGGGVRSVALDSWMWPAEPVASDIGWS